MRTTLQLILLLPIVAFLFLGCGGEAPVVQKDVPCSAHADCSGSKLCLDGYCSEPGGGCTTATDCPQGFKCLSDGTCGDVECEIDSDCCPTGRACAKSCTNFKCFGSVCSDGGAKDCFIGCHKGESICVQGDWAACNAPPVLPSEVCDDSIDNDCNGQVDEGCAQCQPGETKLCAGPCGDGLQHCGADGQLTACDAPTDCTCEAGQTSEQPCEKCGYFAGSCLPDGTWNYSTICAAQGPCEIGEEATQPCGSCGEKQKRVCGDDCTWGEWSTCESGECEPGDEEKEACGVCGSKKRVCLEDCSWSAWSACDAQDGCSDGQTNEKKCGLCGVQTQTCNGCQWSEFGACTGEGVCNPGQVHTENCGNCGEKTRKCSVSTCQWGSWSSCLGEGPCAVGSQQEQDCGPSTEEGQCKFGTQVKSCGATCQWGNFSSCAGAVNPKSEICGNGLDENCDGEDDTLPDEYEKNDTCGTCYWLGDDPDVTLFASFDNDGDTKDYYCFKGIDNFNLPLTGENVLVELKNQSVGVDGDLALYKGYSDCGSGSNKLATSITIGGANETIDWAEGNGDDEGTYIIEVSSWGDTGCYKSYTLSVKGLK